MTSRGPAPLLLRSGGGGRRGARPRYKFQTAVAARRRAFLFRRRRGCSFLPHRSAVASRPRPVFVPAHPARYSRQVQTDRHRPASEAGELRVGEVHLDFGSHLHCRAIEDPKPFKWTKSADDILAAVKRFCLCVDQNLCHEL